MVVINRPLFTGKSHYSFLGLLFVAFYFSLVVYALFFAFLSDAYLYMMIVLGALTVYFITLKVFFLFYVFEKFILIKYPFKFKNREEIILLENIKHIEYTNQTGRYGPRGVAVICPKEGMIKTRKLHFDDFADKNAVVFLKLMYSRGIEIDISNCYNPENTLLKIRSNV